MKLLWVRTRTHGSGHGCRDGGCMLGVGIPYILQVSYQGPVRPRLRPPCNVLMAERGRRLRIEQDDENVVAGLRGSQRLQKYDGRHHGGYDEPPREVSSRQQHLSGDRVRLPYFWRIWELEEGVWRRKWFWERRRKGSLKKARGSPWC
ncbi:serine/threonine receptor-like kinase NFP [Iris pallida]|uniref:Serine/threonine receptor-like kinase NFP n=1 Tax=Iris pallida TaxID=29817 RepID=A0AAX6GD96_IRIPA|nr:serine/threonine receptor-like kinase NFP [Iris pallida]